MSRDLLLSALAPRVAESPSESFRFCGSIKDYLLQRAAVSGIDLTHSKPSAAERSIAENVGTTNLSKFRKLLQEWHSFDKPIPLTYLTMLKVERHVLEALFEYELEQFESVAKASFRPESYLIRWMPAIYTSETFPRELLSEEECIAFLQARVKARSGTQAIINSSVKTVWISHGQEVTSTWHKPEMRFTKSTVLFRSARIIKKGSLWVE